MLQLSFILVFMLGIAVGWFERDVRVRMRIMTKGIVALMNNKAEKPEPPPEGKVIEPSDDPIAAARAEFEARSKRLNQ